MINSPANSLYSNFQNWQKNATNNPSQKTSFNFMEGKDASNIDTYNAQLIKLAQGEMAQKDANGDGILSLEEYQAAELKDLAQTSFDTGVNASEDDILSTSVYSQILFQFIDEANFEAEESNQALLNHVNQNGLGNDVDGGLSVYELAMSYKLNDKFENGQQVDQADGVIVSDENGSFTGLVLNEIGVKSGNDVALAEAYINTGKDLDLNNIYNELFSDIVEENTPKTDEKQGIKDFIEMMFKKLKSMFKQ